MFHCICVCTVYMLICFVNVLVPVPRISSGSLQGVVGEKQDIICSVTITSAIDPDLVKLTWRNAESNITADSRVTIITNITHNPFSFAYTTVIHFTYLMEGDEGNYTCNVKVDDMMESCSIILQNFRSMQTLKILTIIYMFLYSQYPDLL